MKKEDIAQIIKLRADGLSIAAIAERFAISSSTVVKMLCDSGHPPTDKAVLIDELLKAGLPLEEIAKAADSSVKTIKSKYLKYIQDSYSFESKTDNAIRIAKHRTHRKNDTSYVEDREPIDINTLDPKRQYLIQCYIEPDVAFVFESALYQNQVNAGEIIRKYVYEALGKEPIFRLHRSPPKKPIMRSKKTIIACNLRAADYAEFYNYCLAQKTTITNEIKKYILLYIKSNKGDTPNKHKEQKGDTK